jgi:LytS/YehU family sensor histidine kinase
LEKQFEYDAEKKDIIAKSEQEKRDIEIRAQKNKRLLTTAVFSLILIMGGSLVIINRKRKESSFRKNLAESEMKALRAQMNPHFMFNSLNAIQQMVLNNDNDNAFHYLDTYSKLTRKILENSEKKYISVQDEIKFLELYLSIESLRFEHSFTYKIEVSTDVYINSDKVPAMIIQPFVENAVKHGLLPKQGDKMLLIRFNKKEDDLLVTVEDNGIGRRRNQEIKTEHTHQSMGMNITGNRLQLLQGKRDSSIIIEDLADEKGEPAGTRILILIGQDV